MASDLDPRVLTLPLFLLGALALAAGLVGIGLQSLGAAPVGDPGGLVGIGLTLALSAGAVTLMRRRTEEPPIDRIPIPMEPRARRARRIAVASSLAAVVLVAAGVYGAGFAGVAGGDGEDVDAAELDGAVTAVDPATLLGVESFAGRLEGAALPMAGGVGTPSATHELPLAAGAGALRVELAWEPAAAGGASELLVVVEAKSGTEWVEVASGTGAPMLVVDATDLPKDASALRVTVSVPDGEGTSGQDYEGRVSAFPETIPEGHTAFEDAEDADAA